ncbi:MAG: hypothetical protein HYV07_17150 [Deltaproteobacteria bacterium]|nr:hypothetical protein [Deltaproteobacteria bacterium]
MKRLALILTFGLVSACGATKEQLVRRAAFDLNCPEPQIDIQELDGRTRGVRGCGRQATYVEQCEVVQGSRSNCTWLLNADAQPAPAAEQPSVGNTTP